MAWVEPVAQLRSAVAELQQVVAALQTRVATQAATVASGHAGPAARGSRRGAALEGSLDSDDRSLIAADRLGARVDRVVRELGSLQTQVAGFEQEVRRSAACWRCDP